MEEQEFNDLLQWLEEYMECEVLPNVDALDFQD